MCLSLFVSLIFFGWPFLSAQNTYMGPIKTPREDIPLVRIEILIRDSSKLGGVQVQSVTFDGRPIPLKPRDIFGNRGKASLQMPPGKYPLEWVVLRDPSIWPRTVTHKEEVTIDARDFWVQISIEGEEASIR